MVSHIVSDHFSRVQVQSVLHKFLRGRVAWLYSFVFHKPIGTEMNCEGRANVKVIVRNAIESEALN